VVLCLPLGHAFVATYGLSLSRPNLTPKMSSSPTTPAFNLDPTETALVLIEYQNEFTTPGGKLHDVVKECMKKTNMLANTEYLVSVARTAGVTIVHCPISFEKVGSEGGDTRPQANSFSHDDAIDF